MGRCPTVIKLELKEEWKVTKKYMNVRETS